MLRPFLIALQLLTRFPLRVSLTDDPAIAAKAAGQSVLYYPLVGLLIGLVLVAVQSIASFVFSGQLLLQSALLLTVWVLITGVLHLDGLADSADAWLGGYGDREKTLAIMQDPYCGPAGVTAILLVLLIKFAALNSVLTQGGLALVMIPVLGRTAVIILFLTTPYVRKGGMGESAATQLPALSAWGIVFVVIAITALLLKWQSSLLFIAVVVTFALLRYLMLRRIAGTTGDTAGALIEIIEVMALVSVAIEVT